MPSGTKPAFGQVWEWVDTKMMLIHHGREEKGQWYTICLDGTGFMATWEGLYDSPDSRLDGWELLSEEKA